MMGFGLWLAPAQGSAAGSAVRELTSAWLGVLGGGDVPGDLCVGTTLLQGASCAHGAPSGAPLSNIVTVCPSPRVTGECPAV